MWSLTLSLFLLHLFAVSARFTNGRLGWIALALQKSHQMLPGDDPNSTASATQLALRFQDDTSGSEVWTDGLKDMTASIEVLDLSHSALGDESLQQLATRLAKMPQLACLVIDDCPMKHDSVRVLVHSLLRRKSLRMLSMAHCDLDDTCLQHLSHLAKANPHIIYWDLSGNAFTSAGVKWLSKLLSPALQLLDISHNQLGNPALILLANVINSTALPDLQELHIRQVGAGRSACLRLLRALPACVAISQLDLSGNALLSEQSDIDKIKDRVGMPAILPSAWKSLTASMSSKRGERSVGKVRRVRSTRRKASARRRTAADPCLPLVQALLQCLRGTRSLQMLGLAKTGLDGSFARLIVAQKQIAAKDSKVDAAVDVRLNDLSAEDKAMLRHHMRIRATIGSTPQTD